MKKRWMIVLLPALSIGLAACNIPGGDDAVSTSVAATLAFMETGKTLVPGVPEATSKVDEEPKSKPPGVLTIAYINDGNVWFVQEGSATVQLTTSGNVTRVILSTDGQLAAFIRRNSALMADDLLVVDAATGTERMLFSQPDLDAIYPLGEAVHRVPYQFDFVPGTHTVLVNTRETFEGPGLMQNNDLWSIDADSGARTLLLEPGQGGDFYLSPSGDMLAITLSTSLGFVRSDGSGRSSDHLTFRAVMTYSEYAYFPEPVWAPDESAVAVLIPQQDPFGEDPARVWRVPLEGEAVPLLDIAGYDFFRHTGDTPAAMAPDLTKVAYLRETSTDQTELVIAPLDGSPERIYASGDMLWHGWNPDSSQFVYGDAPRNLLLGSVGLPAAGLGVGGHLRWVDADTFLYLDQLTTTQRFGKVDLPGSASVFDEISGSVFDYDFTN